MACIPQYLFLPILLEKMGLDHQLAALLCQTSTAITKTCAFLLSADFDEQTADDWDVDMSIYYDKGI